MSASTEKKLRQAARQAGTDKKTLAMEKEAKEKAKQKRRWTLGTIAVILLIAFIFFLNSNLLYRTTALTIADEDYSASQMNYYYGEQYYYMVNQYGSYVSLFGLDTSSGLKGLEYQPCTISTEEMSWRDYFLQTAERTLVQEKALRDYAAENGIELSQEELDAVEASFDGMEEYATSQGYASADNLFAANYGPGVNTDMVRAANRDSTLVSKAMTEYSDGLEFSQEEIDETYAAYNGEQDYFNYAYYYVLAETTEVTGEDGETTSQVSDEALAASEDTANAILEAYLSGEEEDYVERLNAAVASQVEDASATQPGKVQGASLGSYKEWMMDSARKAGDATVSADSSGSGYYVVVFLSRDNNDYNMAQVRHILVKVVADEEGNYTEEAKAEALAKAEDILAEYEAGDKTEESFAALAEEYSEDTGSNTNGGLYDAVTKGQMVEEFDKFCFEGHKHGDTAIVYGESSSYAGYHVMYYVGEGENYADYIARTDLENQAVSQWLSDITAGYTAVEGFGIRFVG